MPKHTAAMALYDFCPIAIIPIITKCFQRLSLSCLKSFLPSTQDHCQFAYCLNRSTDDAITPTPHSGLTHLDKSNPYVRMLFIDFNFKPSVNPSKRITKLTDLEIITSICNWSLDFLTSRPQFFRFENDTSSIIITQGYFLCTLLYTHDCVLCSWRQLHHFADDLTVVHLISNDDQTVCREEVQHLVVWCTDKNWHSSSRRPRSSLWTKGILTLGPVKSCLSTFDPKVRFV